MKSDFYVPPFKNYFIPDIIGENSFCGIQFGTNKSEVKSKILKICIADTFIRDNSNEIHFKFTFENKFEYATAYFENDLFSNASFHKDVKEDDCSRIYDRICNEICNVSNSPCNLFGDYPYKQIISDTICANVNVYNKYESGKQVDGMKSISVNVRKSVRTKNRSYFFTTKLFNYIFAFLIIVLAYLFALNSRYRYEDKGIVRIDKWTDKVETYEGNGVWKIY